MKSRNGTARRQIRFEDLPGALATLIHASIRNRAAAGGMPTLLTVLRKAGGEASTGDELMVLHLAAIDIALQVDGRFNGLVHRIILGKTADALAADGQAADAQAADGRAADAQAADALAADGGLRETLQTRLPIYLEWMYDFVAAQLDADLREPRELLGLEDPADSAVVIVALGELLSLYHGTVSGWDLMA